MKLLNSINDHHLPIISSLPFDVLELNLEFQNMFQYTGLLLIKYESVDGCSILQGVLPHFPERGCAS